ncbi:MAG: XrtA-associated tyrosine autokinase, partial [Pseudomonadota bacterium]
SIVEKAMKRRRKGGGDKRSASAAEAVPAQADTVERAMSRFSDGDAPAPKDHSLVSFAEAEETEAEQGAVLDDDAEILAAAGAEDEEIIGAIANAEVELPPPSVGPTRAPVAKRARRTPPTLELPMDALRESGLLPAERQTRHIEDQYRRIKRPLLANAFGINTPRLPNGNLIMVASSLPGEGKSFTSFNLAVSIAHELDRTVLLVDADVAKPHISRALQVHDQPGLIDLLSDPSLDLQDVILPTSMDSMRLLPAGPIHRHSTELLASSRMEQVVRELGERYPDRVIVFDTPPLIPTTEAQAMAHLMGQIVVVVHAGHTPQHAVLQALETVEGTGHISLILNKTRTAWGEEYGGYGYGGRYGYGT